MLARDNPQTRIFTAVNIILFGFVAAVIFHYIFGAYLKLGYPFNTFLFSQDDKFNDFFHPLSAAALKNPYDYYSLT